MPYTSYAECNDCEQEHGLAAIWNDENCRTCGGELQRVREYVQSGVSPE